MNPYVTWLRRLVVGLVLAALVLAVATARLYVWPDLPQLPARADAIIELGGPGDRDSAALALARAGKAPVLIQSTVQAEAGTHTCLPPVTDVQILCFHANPGTTRGEARYIGSLAAQRGWTSVILVTSPAHALRAQLRVSRCFPGQVYVSTSMLPPLDWFTQIPYQWAASIKAVVFQRGC